MKAIIKALCFLLLISFAWPGQAEGMSSASFTVEAAGVSSGGGPAVGTSFRTYSILGQSTPIRIGANPSSASFRNYPGLLYLFEAALPGMNRGFLPAIFQLLLLGDE
jgi:hypothetical protein